MDVNTVNLYNNESYLPYLVSIINEKNKFIEELKISLTSFNSKYIDLEQEFNKEVDNLKKEIKHSIIEFDMEDDNNISLNDNKKKLIVKNEPEEMIEFGNHKTSLIEEDNKIENENSTKLKDEKDNHLSFDDLRNEILHNDIEE